MLSTFAFIAPYLRIICISLFLIYSESITNAFPSCSSNCHLIIVHTLLPSVVLRADVKIHNSLKKMDIIKSFSNLHIYLSYILYNAISRFILHLTIFHTIIFVLSQLVSQIKQSCYLCIM